ncbi:hypothetical protein D3C84_975730 [compost metagenome]
MFSTPVIACSSGEATVLPSTSGLAPGNCARTTMVGGTTSGYSLTGSWNSDTAPPIRMSSDSTMAKMGRRTKNCEKFMTCSSAFNRAAHRAPARSRRWLWRRVSVRWKRPVVSDVPALHRQP